MAIEGPKLKYFYYQHLSGDEKLVTEKFHKLLSDITNMDTTDDNEYSVGVRKLLEAKDCFVRAVS